MKTNCCDSFPAKERKLQPDGQPRIKMPGLAEKVWKLHQQFHKEAYHKSAKSSK